MNTELTIATVRHQLIRNTNHLGIEVVYCEYDFETSQWNVELRLEQTLPPNRHTTSAVRVVESITNRVHVRLDHDLEAGETITDKIHGQLTATVAQLHTVGMLSLKQAVSNRIQPASEEC